jgi:hypothetical protein
MTGNKLATDKSMIEDFEIPVSLGVNKEQLAKYCFNHKILQEYIPDTTSVNREFLIKLIAAHERATIEKLTDISNA